MYPPGNYITYPTLGKENHLQKYRLVGDMLVPWRVYIFYFVSTPSTIATTLPETNMVTWSLKIGLPKRKLT